LFDIKRGSCLDIIDRNISARNFGLAMGVNKGELQPLNNLFSADMGIQNLLITYLLQKKSKLYPVNNLCRLFHRQQGPENFLYAYSKG